MFRFTKINKLQLRLLYTCNSTKPVYRNTWNYGAITVYLIDSLIIYSNSNAISLYFHLRRTTVLKTCCSPQYTGEVLLIGLITEPMSTHSKFRSIQWASTRFEFGSVVGYGTPLVHNWPIQRPAVSKFKISQQLGSKFFIKIYFIYPWIDSTHNAQK